MHTWNQYRRKWQLRLGRRQPGRVETIEGVESPELGNRRDLYVYVPGSYGRSHGRYPVIYMHDGQNIFDPAMSFAGSWLVHEAMDWAAGRGIEGIGVGIPNMGQARLAEYSPFPDPQMGGGEGDTYLDFVTKTVKPLIDGRYRTLADRRHTGIMGSSMGGLISLYGFFRHPDTFGFAGVMSPALWFGHRAIVPFVAGAPYVPGKVYLDVGTEEGSRTVADAREMRDLLIGKGYQPGRGLRYAEDIEGRHEEAAWARRIYEAIPFLLT